MKYYNLGTSSKPCGILKWRGLTIMLDASLDISIVLNFLPLPKAGNSKFNSPSHYQNFRSTLEKELCEFNNFVFVDGTPLFGVPNEVSVDISEIDIILVSNSASLLALPFITEHPDFNGSVYATEPTVNIGRFFMEEIVEFVTSVPKPCPQQESKDSEQNEPTRPEPNIFKRLEQSLNFPIKLNSHIFNKSLKEIYNKKSISDALLKVRIVGFNENTDIFGKVLVTAVSSGFSLGSCNWIFKSENKKIVYVTSSSTLTTHPSPMEQGALKDADIFILNGLNRAPIHNPDAMMGEICMSVLNTLRSGGNVIFPCYPSGIIYDLFECLSAHLENTGYGTFPFYFISPHAESSLAYSNILAEWLSATKQRKVYIPEDPFPHAQLVKDGRLKHFKTLHDVKELRQPCVMFCSHPSLRFGDVVHLVEAWGSNHANTIIFTEAEFPYIEALIPYQNLAMKVNYCPIDTSLNFHQTNKLIKELKPTILITHEEYLTPPKSHPQRSELIIEHPQIEVLSPGSVISLKLKRHFVSTKMDAKLANKLNPVLVGDKGHMACTISAAVDNMNNKYRLMVPSLDLCEAWKNPPLKYTWGTLDSGLVLHKLAQEGITHTKITHTSTGFIISLPSENTVITTDHNNTNIVCASEDSSLRTKLRKALTSCLQEF